MCYELDYRATLINICMYTCTGLNILLLYGNICTKLKENMKIITVLDNNVSVVIMTSAVHLFSSSVKMLNNDINKTNSSDEHHNGHFRPDNHHQVQVWVMAYVDLLQAAVALLLRGNTLKIRQFFRSCATHDCMDYLFRLGSVAIITID